MFTLCIQVEDVFAVIMRMAQEIDVLKSKVAEMDNKAADDHHELVMICSNLNRALQGKRDK